MKGDDTEDWTQRWDGETYWVDADSRVAFILIYPQATSNGITVPK